jgi:sugar O-acyltransferase (sialic acid O-acetyltransferase NeuD family)
MPKSVVIVGASGHGKVIADIVIKSGDNITGFLDDADELPEEILGIPVLGKVDDYVLYSDCEFIIGIGNASIREKIANRLQDVVWYTAIHPTAVISTLDVSIGCGSVVMANAVINTSAKIGNHCIVNTGAIVEHDNVLDDYVHISPNASLAGTVRIGKYSHIGIGACVRNNLSITSHCIVGAGATVVNDLSVPGIYVGVPARRL